MGLSTPRHPGAALGDVPALLGAGGYRLASVRACPLLAQLLTKDGQFSATRARVSGARLTRGVGSGQIRAFPSPLQSVAHVCNVQVGFIII